ncbi:hypothetical protein AB0F72_31235 [Actinoplanes sp. NPDC023936]|uniref:hypothetical protein n=1 Tax=Actinoplanes sp. NPDC023936 TaxID=3154910 RepID=UPI0033CAA7DD
MRDDGMQADQDGTMMLGLHGTFAMFPWLSDRELDDDAFSLVQKRAAAYGFESSPAPRWNHHEAGGDWTPGGDVRERCWLQAGVPGDGGAHRLPVVPGVRVLTDVVNRVGIFGFTGLHAVVPMHLAHDIGFDLADAADWFALANPDAGTDLVVTVSADMSLDLPARASALAGAAAERGPARLGVRPAEPGRARPGLAGELTGEMFVPGDWNREQAFHCRAPEWTPDVAAWMAEIFLDALREVAPTEGMALVTVSALSGGA